MVFLDLSAAFDLVNPALLLEKLKLYGLHDYVLSWFKSYLTSRYQSVWIDNVLSDFRPCKVGVPQGSNLGPLLFLIFYNDLPSHLNCDNEAYADDSTMSVSGKTVEDISLKLTENCARVVSWMEENGLKLNASKTHILTVGTNRRLQRQENIVQVEMDGIILKESESKVETLLGYKIQVDLKWHSHINEVLKKLKCRVNVLEHLKFTLPYELRKVIVEGI